MLNAMKKDNNRNQDSRKGSKSGSSKEGKREFSSFRSDKKSTGEGGGRSTTSYKGRNKKDDSKAPRWSTEKPSYAGKSKPTEKKEFSLEGHPKKKYTPKTSDYKPSGSYGKSSYKKDQADKKDNTGEFKTLYKGRGKDEKPVFETVKRAEFEKKTAKKKHHKVMPAEAPKEPRPTYNFDTIEKKQQKEKKEESIRLNKYISNSGICSRREADNLIESGEFKVNGQVITEMGYKVQLSDVVTYKGKNINPEKPVYVLLNKPKDFITTTDDPMERKTVMQLVSNACNERIFPVGRLDRNTTGLLLFTNDGELAAKLSHPSNQIKKIYQVTLDKPLTKGDEEVILEGFDLEDGPVKVNDMKVLSKDRTILGLEIHIGRNRVVRRIFSHFGYEVIALDRVMYAGLDKKDLTRGNYRFLTEKEVINLKFFR